MLLIEREEDKVNMKWLLVVLGVLCACHATPRYVIKGKLANYSGKIFLITSSLEKKHDTLVSAEVKKGIFEICGGVQEPVAAWLQTENGDLKVPVFLENTSFSLEGDINQPKNYMFTGGRLQGLREQFREEVEDSIQVYKIALQKEYREAAAENNLFRVMHVRAKMADLDSVYEKKENAFLRENNNIVSVSLIHGRLNKLLRMKKLREKFELLGDTARNSLLGKELRYYLEREQSTATGAIAPDFTMDTPDGISVSLHSVKAKVKILDFWASWCGPCRAENPNVKRVYDKYHADGLEIISVSLDSEKERWVKAIKQDNLPWIHVSDLLGWENAAAKLYGVRGVPFILVLDKDDRIIGSGLRGEELEEFVVKAL
ncbi:thioredoxin-like domain-containing protein [Butyricimonas paravirosa]